MQAKIEKPKSLPSKASNRKLAILDPSKAIADIVSKVDPNVLKDMIEDIGKERKLPIDNYV